MRRQPTTGLITDCGGRQFGAVLAAMLILLGGRTAPAVADEIAIREQLKEEAAQLLRSGDIASFDRRATELRNTRERTPAGIWKLYPFYKACDHLPLFAAAAGTSACIWAMLSRRVIPRTQAISIVIVLTTFAGGAVLAFVEPTNTALRWGGPMLLLPATLAAVRFWFAPRRVPVNAGGDAPGTSPG